MNSNEDYGIVKFPLITEKSIRLNERENKIIFIVDKKSNKNDIKNAVERIFNVLGYKKEDLLEIKEQTKLGGYF